MMATRWGIVSAGMISNDFVTGVQLLPSTDHQVVAVGARNLEKAQAFAKRLDIPNAYGSYEELSKDPAVDVVYVGTINSQHLKLCKMMLRAGKHVLCEKPLCLNERQVREVLAVATDSKRFLMEGVWSRFFPAYQRVREELAKGTIGEARVVTANFGFSNEGRPDDNTARLVDKEGGGAIIDMGVYCAQFVDMVFGGKPEKVSTVGHLTSQGVDDTNVTTLTYSGGRMASFTNSVSTNLNQTAYIQGTKGVIRVPWIWCPNEIYVNDERHEFPLPKSEKAQSYWRGEGFSYEAQHVRVMLLKGALESPIMPHSSSLNVVRILDEARKQIGNVYEADLV